MGYNKRNNFSGRHNFHENFHENRYNNYERTPPVKVGDELNVTIEAVAEKGDGLAKKDGFVIFVPGTQTGDKVRIRVTKVLRRVGFAEKIGEASADKGETQTHQRGDNHKEETEKYEDSEDFGEDSENF